MTDPDHQTDERGGQNLRENGEGKKETSRKIVVLLK